jgi:hypothetical protein
MRLIINEPSTTPDAPSISVFVETPKAGTLCSRGTVTLAADMIKELGTVLVKLTITDYIGVRILSR